VTIQAQVLDLMKKLRDELGTSIIMITHDLGVVAEMCDRAIVMYCGSAVEEGTVEEIFKNPQHPYTQGLLASIPKLPDANTELYNIKGTVPNLTKLPQGCRFAERCEHCTEQCQNYRPGLTELTETHKVRCFLKGGAKDE
jgi:peptide/nickel transport system ATP-binding protein